MSSLRLLRTLALGLALLAPAVHAGGPDQVYVGSTLVKSSDPNRPPEQRWEYLVIYNEGLALREIPPGGLEYDNVAALAEKHDSKVGSYTRTDDGIQITWGRSSRRNQTWDLAASGRDWTRGTDTIFKRADQLNKDAIKGIWQGASSMPSNMVDMSSGGEFIFRSNGEFEQGKKHGHFELDGYTLILHDSTGTTRRYAIYRWPWTPGTIVIDRGLYRLLQSRR
jgi:hypothetical protein